MPSPVAITATLNDPSGSALQGNSYVRFILRGYTGFVPIVTGTSVVCEIQVDALPNGSGLISQNVWRNADITPASTFYTVQFCNQGRVISQGNYIFNAATSLNTAGPVNTPPVPPGFSLVFENNDVLNSSQSLLDLKSTDGSITITDLGAGQINFQAAAGGLRPGDMRWFPGSTSTPVCFMGVGDFTAAQDAGSTASFINPTGSTNMALSMVGSREINGCTLVYGGRNFTFSTTANVANVATTQVAIGLFSSFAWVNLGGSTGVPSGNLVAFYLPPAGTTWHAITSGGGSVTDVDTLVSAYARHVMSVAYTPTSAVFKIDGVVVATITTNLPSAGSMFMYWVSTRSGAGQTVATEYLLCSAGTV